MGQTLSCSVTDTTGSLSHSMQTALRVAFLATVSLAAPAPDADADPYYGYGYAPYVAHAPYVHAPLVLPVCKVITKTVVVGQSCHAEPECSTKSVVVGKAVTDMRTPSVRMWRLWYLLWSPMSMEREMLRLTLITDTVSLMQWLTQWPSLPRWPPSTALLEPPSWRTSAMMLPPVCPSKSVLMWKLLSMRLSVENLRLLQRNKE